MCILSVSKACLQHFYLVYALWFRGFGWVSRFRWRRRREGSRTDWGTCWRGGRRSNQDTKRYCCAIFIFVIFGVRIYGLGKLHLRLSLGSFFLHLQAFFCTSKIFLNSQNILWLFKEIHGHHTPKNTSESQNIWLSEVKIYHQKSTFRSQNISPEVDFQKSKNFTEVDFRK